MIVRHCLPTLLHVKEKQLCTDLHFRPSGFDLLQELQGGGGYSDDSFLFQAGGVDRCLNQIYSIYLDS